MNESTVTFWQVMMVLQIRLAASIFAFGYGMEIGLKGIWSFFTKRKVYAGYPQRRDWMVKPVKGEKI